MDLFSQAPRAGQGLAAGLASQQLGGAYRMHQIMAADLFPDMKGMAKAIQHPSMAFLSWLWSVFEGYGQLCSIIVGTGLLFRMCTWVMGVSLRLFTTPVVGNPVLHVLCAFFPSLREFIREPRRFCACCFGRRRRDGYQPPQVEPLVRRRPEDPLPDPPEGETQEAREERHERLIDRYAERTAERLAEKLESDKDEDDADAVLRAAALSNPSYVGATAPLYPDPKELKIALKKMGRDPHD